jgi:phosphate uptake regulator
MTASKILVVENDKKINQKRFVIEEKSVQLIATQQPMASDLHTIICVLNIITELERIGDHAEGTAKISDNDRRRAYAEAADRPSSHG